MPAFRLWILLVVCSVALGIGFIHLHIPGALLLGPMIVGVIMSLCGAKIWVNRQIYICAQVIIGCMIAQSISPSIISQIAEHWLLVIFILISTLAASTFCGWMLVRFSSLPGATGAWGSSPGGAAAMVAMAESYGADVRLVAFMQYIRVLLVAAAAVIVARIALGSDAAQATEVVWFPKLDQQFIWTLLIAAACGWLGLRSKIPSGVMLLPMIIGALLQGGGIVQLQLPEWLLAMAYCIVGWAVGLRFNREVLILALRSLPQILLSTLSLMLFCVLMAFIVTKVMNIDLLTAYLATSPGGLDTIAIIAAGSQGELSFVMAIQTLRLFMVLMTGPAIARFLSRYAETSSA